MFTAIVVLHVIALAIVVGVASGVVPPKWYDGPLRGLHNTIGITTPTPRQLRWVLIVWVLSMAAIFDAMALLLSYVF